MLSKHGLNLFQCYTDNLMRIGSKYKEYEAQVDQVLRQIEQISLQLSSTTDKRESFQEMERLLERVKELNDEKLVCSSQMNKLIAQNVEELDRIAKSQKNNRQKPQTSKEVQNSSSPQEVTSAYLEPSCSSTPIAKPDQVRKKRGRKPKNASFESKEESSGDSPKCHLMLLANAAIIKEEKEAADAARNQSHPQVPITKCAVKRKRRKTKGTSMTEEPDMSEDDEPEPEKEIDENEPLYCLCNKTSFGSMVECENDACSIEWFHFNCVGLKKEPKGKW